MKILYDPAALQEVIKEPCEPNYCTCNGGYDPCLAQTCGPADQCAVNCPPNNCLELGCNGRQCTALTCLVNTASGGSGLL
jgi:hypothetical protein